MAPSLMAQEPAKEADAKVPPPFILPLDGRVPADLPEALPTIQEESLPFDTTKNAKDLGRYKAPVYSGEKAGVGPTLRDNTEYNRGGIRYFRVQVKPGETFTVQCQGAPADKVHLRYWIPARTDPFHGQLRRTNEMLRQQGVKLEFRNTLDAVYALVFAAEGFVDYPYRLTLTRKP
jgi:hypothetical protein